MLKIGHIYLQESSKSSSLLNIPYVHKQYVKFAKLLVKKHKFYSVIIL